MQTYPPALTQAARTQSVRCVPALSSSPGSLSRSCPCPSRASRHPPDVQYHPHPFVSSRMAGSRTASRTRLSPCPHGLSACLSAHHGSSPSCPSWDPRSLSPLRTTRTPLPTHPQSPAPHESAPRDSGTASQTPAINRYMTRKIARKWSQSHHF